MLPSGLNMDKHIGLSKSRLLQFIDRPIGLAHIILKDNENYSPDQQYSKGPGVKEKEEKTNISSCSAYSYLVVVVKRFQFKSF